MKWKNTISIFIKILFAYVKRLHKFFATTLCLKGFSCKRLHAYVEIMFSMFELQAQYFWEPLQKK